MTINLIFIVCIAVLAVGSQPPIKIGTINPFTNAGSYDTYVKATLDGLNMVVSSVNAKGGVPNLDGTPSGRMIELVELDNEGNETTAPGMLRDALEGNHSDIMMLAVSVAGRFITPLEPVLSEYNLTIVGPITGESTYYKAYDPRFVNIAPSADAELLGLLRYLVVRKKLKRIALVRPHNLEYGRTQNEFADILLQQLGMALVDILWIDHSTLTFASELAELLAAKPQGILFYGPLSTSSAYALGVLLQASSDLIIAIPFAANALSNLVLQSQASSIVNDRLFSGGYAPHQRDTSFEIVNSYLATAAAATSLTYPLATILADDSLGQLSFTGYLHARFIVEMLRRNVNVTSREQVRMGLFDSTIVPIDDLYYGVFSGVCSGSRISLCECNNGAHSVYFNHIEANRSYTALPLETMNTPIGTCREENLLIPSPLLQLQVLDISTGTTGDISELLSDCSIGSAAAYGLTPTSLQVAANSVVDSSVTFPTLDHVTRDSDTESLNPVESQVNDYILTVIAGSLTKYGAQNSSILRAGANSSYPLTIATVDDLSIIPYRSTSFEMHTVRVTSTMEQDIHTLASYASLQSISMSVVSSSVVTDSEYFLSSFSKSVTTFSTTVDVSEIVSTSSGLSENPVAARLRSMSTKGVVLAIGLLLSTSGAVTNEGDAVSALSQFLTSNPAAQVALPLSTILTLYSHLNAQLGASHLSRVLLATNLPRWGSPRSNSSESNATDDDASSLSETSNYFTTVPLASRSPATMWHYIVQKFIYSVVERVSGTLTSDSLLTGIYLISSFVVEEGLTVGPFYKGICTGKQQAGVDSCETNIGARKIFVYTLAGAQSSVAAATDPTVKPIHELQLTSGAVVYTTPDEESDSSLSTVIIVACVVGSLLLLAAVTGLIFLFCCTGRANKTAPKDEAKPFTIAFTDIQSSTALWAEIPEVMAPALDLHHANIRHLIADCEGYEVKTIGDSFMVAFTSSTNALHFALSIQSLFHSDIKWPGNDAIDTMYMQFDEIRIASIRDLAVEHSEKDIPKLSINLSHDIYQTAWNGLRVRVGIHCGFGEIKKDEVSGGYDYYGSVVNTAARVESVAHGGQVVATRDVLEAIIQEGNVDALGVEIHPDAEPSPQLVHLSLGPVPLRGVPHPIELIQFSQFQHRVFPSLRLDHFVLLDDEVDGDTILDDIISESEMSTSEATSTSQADIRDIMPGPILKLSGTLASGTQSSSSTQLYSHRLNNLVQKGTSYLEALLSALPPSSQDSTVKMLCEKWRVRVVSYDNFLTKHTARIKKAKEALNRTSQIETLSNGSRSRRSLVPEEQLAKLRQYIEEHGDARSEFRMYQLSVIAKRIAPVVAAKEDKVKSKFFPKEQRRSFTHSVNVNVNFGLGNESLSSERLEASAVSMADPDNSKSLGQATSHSLRDDVPEDGSVRIPPWNIQDNLESSSTRRVDPGNSCGLVGSPDNDDDE